MTNELTSTSNHSLRNDQPLQVESSINTGSLHEYLHAATTDNTRKAYRSAIRQFEKWGGRLPADGEMVVRYLLAKAGSLNPRTLDLHLTAISQWHRYQGLNDPASNPVVRKTIEGVRRTHGQPKHKAKALRLEHIAQMVSVIEQLPESPKKHRDLAMLLTGFFGAFRRSELVAIQVSDLTWEPEGLVIKLPKSKTDQHASGMSRALPFADPNCCPATAIRHWLKVAKIESGPLFRPVNRWSQVQSRQLNPGAVNDVLKSVGKACQFDFVPDLSSHSLRRGLSTSAARENVDFSAIKKQGGWKSDATVWEYIDEGQQFDNNAAKVLLAEMSQIMSRG